MAEMTLKDIAKAMKDIDYVMFSTHTEGGEIASRPMSNNHDVEYDGDSYFFAVEPDRLVPDLERDARVNLAVQGAKGLMGKPPLFLSIEGKAELIRDKAAFKAHWNKDIEHWTDDGVDTKGLVLIKVHAQRVHYWDGREQGELRV